MSTHLKVGDKAPDFELPGSGNKTIRLSRYLHQSNVILSFHPLAFTGICSEQMKDLQKNMQKLRESETVALGISVDSVPAKEAWAKQINVTDVAFLSDFEPKGAVDKQYGIYHPKGFSERAVFVVNKEGILTFVKVYPINEKPDPAEFLSVSA